jgi:ankyrin repeat protein
MTLEQNIIEEIHMTIEQETKNKLLFKAVDDEYLGAIEFLINNGADINAKDIYGDTPLLDAIYGDTYKTFCKILDLGADINAQRLGFKKTTFLHEAVRLNFKLFVEKLCKMGADLTIKDSNGQTPLDMAKGWGFYDCINIIESYGSKKNTIEISYDEIDENHSVLDMAFLLKKHGISDFQKFNITFNNLHSHVPILINRASFGLDSIDELELYIRKKSKC